MLISLYVEDFTRLEANDRDFDELCSTLINQVFWLLIIRANQLQLIEFGVFLIFDSNKGAESIDTGARLEDK